MPDPACRLRQATSDFCSQEAADLAVFFIKFGMVGSDFQLLFST